MATEDILPEWVPIYFVKNGEDKYRCNICLAVVETDAKSMDLLKHITDVHKEIFDLHKENPDASVGFQIEFLQLNVLKDDEGKDPPLILEELTEAAVDEGLKSPSKDDKTAQMHYVVLPKKKKPKHAFEFTRKRSWVWKYFDKLSNIIYRCNLCQVVLSIKGCNTNNMNRHVRTRHPSIYKSEVEKKKDSRDMEICGDGETYIIKSEEVLEDNDEEAEKMSSHRRSWIWSYFKRVSSSLAQCTLCCRNICHGGNATGNMNRHLKMIHQKTGPDDMNWVWKVIDADEQDFYSCKICQFKCMKFSNEEKSMSCILSHLNSEHGVVSGDQIITGTEYDLENS